MAASVFIHLLLSEFHVKNSYRDRRREGKETLTFIKQTFASTIEKGKKCSSSKRNKVPRLENIIFPFEENKMPDGVI